MTDEAWSAVDRLIADLLLGADPALAAALEANAAAGLPAHEVSPAQGKLLQLLVAAVGARSVLEIGTLGGYSSIWLGRGLPENGRLVSLELDPGYAEVARANLAQARLAAAVEVITGPAAESMAALSEAGRGPFDLIFIDADKRSNPDYLRRALELSRPGTVIVADNVIRGGEVADPASADPRVRGVRAFLELVASEPRLSATAIQTVGQKGYDGFAIALVSDRS